MSTNISDILLLFQINDTQFPIGAYSHSYGFETYIQDRTITDEEGAGIYLLNYLQGTFLYNDLFAAFLAYQAAQDKNSAQVVDLNRKLRAYKPQKELREASEKLGSRLIHTVDEMQLDLGPFFHEAQEASDTAKVAMHHAVAYGLITGLLGLDRDLALSSYCLNTAAGMTSNAVKTIPISQFAGQRILNAARKEIEDLVRTVQTLDPEDFGVSFPGVDIASMRHEHLYSRLYMS